MIKYECDICHNQFTDGNEITSYKNSDKGKVLSSFDVCRKCRGIMIHLKNYKNMFPLPNFTIGMKVSITDEDDYGNKHNGIISSIKLDQSYIDHFIDFDYMSFTQKTQGLYLYDIVDIDDSNNIISDIPENCLVFYDLNPIPSNTIDEDKGMPLFPSLTNTLGEIPLSAIQIKG